MTHQCNNHAKNHLRLEIGCIVRDRRRVQYRVADICDGKVIIYPMDGFRRLSGSLSAARRELEIIVDAEGYDKDGYDQYGFDRDGYDWRGFDQNGFNKEGRDVRGFDRKGYDKDGYDRSGFNKEGLNREGKRRGEGRLPSYTGSCYAGAPTSWPGAQKSKKR